MPISHKHKILFIHVPKCAGTTVEQILDMSTVKNLFATSCPTKEIECIYSFENFSEIEKKRCQLKNPQHYTYKELKKILPPDVINTYYKFAIVRNPYTRLASAYMFAKIKQSLMKKRFSDRFPSFSEFVNTQLYVDYETRLYDYDGHLETQTSFLESENGSFNELNRIFKFEQDLPECLSMLKAKTRINFDVHSRKSTYDKPIQELYDFNTQEIVYNFYKDDFINFGYSKELC